MQRLQPNGRLWNFVIAVDQLIATWFGAWPDETLSSYAWRLERAGDPEGHYWRVQIDDIFEHLFGVRDHCENAHASHMIRNSIPPEER
jgi:hypothetical protein